uniref:Uncharacterized protein n=1 Tax=Parascaris equorum TaxID=6256 RepID=A0A914S4E8_PAREQ
MTRDRAPSISLTVSASVLDETSSLTITAASIAEVYNDDKDENVDPLLGYIESTETVHKGVLKEETIGAPVKESDAYQHVQTERVCANKKEQMVHSDDFVGEAETDFGLSRRWVSRKSYAYGQGFGIINREHLTAARRYSTGPFKLAGSDVKDSANEEVTIISRTMELEESSASKEAPKNRWDDTTITENRGRSSLSTMNTPRSMRDELLGILDVTYGGHPTAPKTNKTILSFKTPKKTVAVPSTKGDSKNASSNKSASKQTESTKNDRVSSGRATSTPNEVEAHVNLAHEDPSSPFRVPSLPIARVQRPSLALSQIADYKSPLYTPKRSAGNTAYTSRSSSSRASLISPRPASSSSRIPAPTNDLGKVSNESGIVAKVQSYLRSGGTPRPNTSAENTRSMPFASQDSVVKSGPRTPAVHFDVSRMLAGNVAASGPVYRRQPLNSGERSRLALPSHAKLNFDDGADSDEEYNTKQMIMVTVEWAHLRVIPVALVFMIRSILPYHCYMTSVEDDPKVDVSDKTGGAAKRTGRSTIARLGDILEFLLGAVAVRLSEYVMDLFVVRPNNEQGDGLRRSAYWQLFWLISTIAPLVATSFVFGDMGRLDDGASSV